MKPSRRSISTSVFVIALLVSITWWLLLCLQTYQLSVDAAAAEGVPWAGLTSEVHEGIEAPHASPVLANLLVLGLAVMGLAYWAMRWQATHAHRRRVDEDAVAWEAGAPAHRAFWVPFVAGIAIVVVSLGLATYTPCVPPGAHLASLAGWVLGLFTADVEWFGPGAKCAWAFAPGFELARSLGLLVTTAVAGSVLWVFLRHHIDRLRVTLSSDTDVVVGLDATTLPLLRTLVFRNEKRPRSRDWCDIRPGWFGGRAPGASDPNPRRPQYNRWTRSWWWLTGLRPGDARRMLKRRPRTVVIEIDPENRYVDLARSLGVLVLIGDATDPRVLRSVLTRRVGLGAKRRKSLRRLYAVTHRQHVNDAVWKAATKVLDGYQVRLLPHPEGLVPRIFIRMDNAREAHAWRLAQLQRWGEDHPGAPAQVEPDYISDSVSLDALAAETVADRVIGTDLSHTPGTVVLVGGSGLALAVLEELAWRLWCRYETQCFGCHTLPEQPALRRMILAGPDAARRAEEWERIRAPWTLPIGVSQISTTICPHPVPLELFTVEAFAEGSPDEVHQGRDDEWEDLCNRILSSDPTAMVVLVDSDSRTAEAASRLARRFPREGAPRVLVRSDQHAASTSVETSGPLRFYPTFVGTDAPSSDTAKANSGQTPDAAHTPRKHAPRDLASRMSRQQHQVYFARYKDRYAPQDPPVLPAKGPDLTKVPWEDAGPDSPGLPRFFAEDNIRQMWQVLSWFSRNGYRWRPVTACDPPSSLWSAWKADIATAARAEYERWASVRWENGWWATKLPKDDYHRMHPDLRGWTDVDEEYNQALVEEIVYRMWATGLVPVPTDETLAGNSDATQTAS